MAAYSGGQRLQINISAGTLVKLLTCCKLSYCSLWMVTWIAAHLKLSYSGPIIPLTSGAPAKRACLKILHQRHNLASTPAGPEAGHNAGCWIYLLYKLVGLLPWSKSMILFYNEQGSVVFSVKVFFFTLSPWTPIFSPNRPTGPIRSSSCDVRPYVSCMSPPHTIFCVHGLVRSVPRPWNKCTIAVTKTQFKQ